MSWPDGPAGSWADRDNRPRGEPTGRIALYGLRVRGHHGVLARERRDGQDFLVDAELDVDLSPAAARDDLAATVDYGGLAVRLAAVVAGDPVDLLETLVDRLLDACLSGVGVAGARVSVHKPQAPVPVPFGDVVVSDTRRAAEVVWSLGGNVGEPRVALAGAVRGLDARAGGAGEPRAGDARAGDGRAGGVAAVSPVYRTAPWGGVPQPDYLNVVVVTRHVRLPAPGRLLAWAQELERAAGRDRAAEQRWGPRPLDVDLVSASGNAGEPVLVCQPDLALPHPRAGDRAFVLQPWLALRPAARLPGRGAVADLLAALDPGQRAGVRPVDPPVLEWGA